MAGSEAPVFLEVAIAKLYFAAVASIWRSKNDGLQRLQLTTLSSLARGSLALSPRMNTNENQELTMDFKAKRRHGDRNLKWRHLHETQSKPTLSASICGWFSAF